MVVGCSSAPNIASRFASVTMPIPNCCLLVFFFIILGMMEDFVVVVVVVIDVG